MAKRSHKAAFSELRAIRRALDQQVKFSAQALKILMEMYRDLGLPHDSDEQETSSEIPMRRSGSGILFVRCPGCALAVCSGIVLSVTEAMQRFSNNSTFCTKCKRWFRWADAQMETVKQMSERVN